MKPLKQNHQLEKPGESVIFINCPAKKMGRKKQRFRPNVLEEGVSRTSRWRLVGTGMWDDEPEEPVDGRQTTREAGDLDWLTRSVTADAQRTDAVIFFAASERTILEKSREIEIHRDDLHVMSLKRRQILWRGSPCRE
jgi:hypothetical protein